MTTAQVTKVFPAYVRGPAGAVDQAAVLVGADTVWVFTRGSGGLPHQWAKVAVGDLDVSQLTRVMWTFTDTEGGEWVVRAEGGCGCSNSMKHMSAEALLAFAGP